MEDGTPPEFDGTSCLAEGDIPPFNEYLNVNAPLQVGGRYVIEFDPTRYHWQAVPYGKGFDGCIKNVFHNSKVIIILYAYYIYLLNWECFMLIYNVVLDCNIYKLPLSHH